MLILSLVASTVLLVAVNWGVRTNRPKVVKTSFIISACTLLGCGLFLLPSFLLQAVLLLFGLLVVQLPIYGRRLYLPLSLVLTIAAYIPGIHFAREQDALLLRLREKFPLESMEQRAPMPMPSSGGSSELSGLVEEEAQSWSRRSYWMKTIHEGRVHTFVNSQGFGVMRMMYPLSEHWFDAPGLHADPIDQPAGYDPHTPSGSLSWGELHRPFGQLHTNSLLDFANPDGFGYVKSRTQVAGFRPHRFSKVPEPVEKWEVRRVELIGLLQHTKPTVYVSEHLPRMDELKDAKTREPDSFEAEGVKAIHGGEDLYTRGGEDAVRMVGAIRSVKQCVECHGGQRGDLLGAFSYQLRREGAK